MAIYTVRFWNKAHENIKVGGRYSHSFDTLKDTWDGAEALLKSAYKLGAVCIDINDRFYDIIKTEKEGK